ncbi:MULTISPECIES: hypothetical protein [Enterococcus]|uniref:hypothetical protein n=1 Tax=Enterococcus TaxID=1350 RepID=UPI0010DFA508|nr:hypothetical protein [Enterococcus gallinarum]MCD4998111.1 hypothetical protein [Enterococcus gallinarum]TXW57809.1 hypothetical protein D4M64_15600 [Enterococcus gallinarum]VTS79338.1 Uncharacterised protein [Enterococcus gallinarum]DAL89327.1 MAG TPA: hypothetical protein [Caudoviricetes sp.]
MEEIVYLDDFFEFLEANGLDTSKIKVVDYEIDMDYVFYNRQSSKNKTIRKDFINKTEPDKASSWLSGSVFY